MREREKEVFSSNRVLLVRGESLTDCSLVEDCLAITSIWHGDLVKKWSLRVYSNGPLEKVAVPWFVGVSDL